MSPLDIASHELAVPRDHISHMWSQHVSHVGTVHCFTIDIGTPDATAAHITVYTHGGRTVYLERR